MNRMMPWVPVFVIVSGCAHVGKAPTPLAPWYPVVSDRGDSVFVVFESRIPCADCEKIKFALALYRNREADTPTTYKMARVHVAKGDDQEMSPRVGDAGYSYALNRTR